MGKPSGEFFEASREAFLAQERLALHITRHRESGTLLRA
jgi:hypothetical protein